MTRTLAAARSLVSRVYNILYNAAFELAPATLTAQTQTNNRWIDGSSGGSNSVLGIGWALAVGGTAGRAGFDNTVSHSGTYSMKLSTTTTGATAAAATFKSSGTPPVGELFPILPNTVYKLTGWIKTTTVASNSAFIDFRTYTSAAATLVTTSSNKLTGTNGWTQVTLTVTTGSTAVLGAVLLRLNVTGNVSDAWFDDIVLAPVTISRTAASGRSLV